ncbi:MAG: hypothetical protein NUV67_03565, partial [archaeon]|nr:hypothetical protein [archaeon]
VTAVFTCGSKGTFPQEQYSTNSGSLLLEKPANCGGITIRASAQGYKTTTQALLGKEAVVRLEGIEKPTGKAEITLKDLETGAFLEGISVKLVDELGGFRQQNGVSSFGEVEFEGVEGGEYTALIEDPREKYVSKTIAVSIVQNEVFREEALLSRDIKLRAKIVVSSSGNRLNGAQVLLFDSLGRIAGSADSNGNGEAVFILGDDGNYSYIANLEGYLPAAKKSFKTSDFEKGSTQEFAFALEKCTPQTCGSLVVRVVDEEGLAIENARVVLLDFEGKVASAYGERATDYNGFTQKFTGIGEGTYRALAQKYPGEGRSNEFTLDPLSENVVEAVIEIGEGTVSVRALRAQDEGGAGIEFAQAEIFSDLGKSLGSIALDEDGRGRLSGIKADKSVYAIITKEGYAPYTTAAYAIKKNSVTQLNAVLYGGVLGDAAIVELAGVLSENGLEARSLRAGATYTAILRAKIPAGLDEAGVFFRAGEAQDVAESMVSIGEINAPGTSIEKSSTYEPLLGVANHTN